jgi:hypothetical protein
MPTLSLDAIEQRIAQRDAELQGLRRDLEARRSRLQALTQRKEELQAKLQQIEAEMAAVTTGAKRPLAAAPKAAPKKPTPQPSTAGMANQQSLASEIVAVIRSAGRPLTARQLAQEVKRRGFKTTSADFTKVVETRLWDLKKRGLVQRAADESGYTLAPSANGPAPKAGVAKTVSPKTPAKTAKHKAHAAPTVPPATGGKAASRLPLHVLLAQILQKQSRPMTGGELAQEALKAGYLTSSKNFAQSVWTALGLMKNVENLKGQGYRLKRGKS